MVDMRVFICSIIDEVMSRITSSPSIDDKASFSPPAPTTQAAEQITEHHLQQQLASIAASSTQNQTMMEQMKTLMSTIADLQTQVNQGTSCGGGDRHRPPRGGNSSTGCSGKIRPKQPRQYCYTHGWCAHSSAVCDSKGPIHKYTATASDMQGGSTNNCFWL